MDIVYTCTTMNRFIALKLQDPVVCFRWSSFLPFGDVSKLPTYTEYYRKRNSFLRMTLRAESSVESKKLETAEYSRAKTTVLRKQVVDQYTLGSPSGMANGFIYVPGNVSHPVFVTLAKAPMPFLFGSMSMIRSSSSTNAALVDDKGSFGGFGLNVWHYFGLMSNAKWTGSPTNAFAAQNGYLEIIEMNRCQFSELSVRLFGDEADDGSARRRLKA